MDPSPSLPRPACNSCANSRPDPLDCDGGYPCSACRTLGARCAYPRATTPPSAWTTIDNAAVQRWPESTQLVPGQAVAFRLTAERDAQGRVEAFGREWMVANDEDLRIRPRRGKTRLLFPASIDERGETEAVDLGGDALDFAKEGQILLNLHQVLPHDPLQPTVGLNAALHDRGAAAKQSRSLRTFEPVVPNFGNVLAACEVPLEGEASSSTCIAFRRAATPGGRPCAVGWGSFAPLPREHRAPSRKGKERATDEDGAQPSSAFRASTASLFTSDHPVRQVELSTLGDGSSALLGVRTQTSLDLVHLSLPSPFDVSLPPTPLSRFTYTAASLSRRPIADFSFGPSPGAGLVVDTDGALFGWGLGVRGSGRIGDKDWAGGQPEMFRLRRGRKKGVGGYSGMARVQCGGVRGTDAVVAVEDEVLLYDLRSPRDSLQLVDPFLLAQHLPHGETDPARVVSLLRRSPASLAGSAARTSQHVVATTQDVLYLDARMPSRALLRWKHGRVGLEAKGADLTLSLLEVPSHPDEAEAGVGRAALTSRLHPHIELYTTQSDPTMAPRFALEPYAVSGPQMATSRTGERFARAGTAFVPLPRTLSASSAASAEAAADAMDVDGEHSSDDDDTPAVRRERLAAAARSARNRSWRVVEAGSRGELCAREVELARFAASTDVDDDEAGGVAEKGAAREAYGEEVARLGAGAERARRARLSGDRRKREEERWMDVRALRKALAPERVLEACAADEEAGGEGVADAAARIVREAAGVAEGDVGALSALELLSLAQKRSTAMDDDDNDDALAVKPLPRHSPYQVCMPTPSDPASALAASLTAAPAAICLAPEDPPTHFSTLLPRTPAPAPVVFAPEASPAARLRAFAASSVARQHELASHVLLPRAIEPDEPSRAPNQPQPTDEDPPALHFSYLRPQRRQPAAADGANGGGGDDLDGTAALPRPGMHAKTSARRRRREHDPPSLDSLGARLLLAEWHVGADPRSYAWHSPYEDDQAKDLDALAVSQAQASSSSRRKKRDREAAAAAASASSSSWQPSFPPSSAGDFASSQHSYFPSLAPPQLPPAIGSSQPPSQMQSQDWPHLAATQPSISVSGPADPSFATSQQQVPPDFGGAASQVVPGAFGSRLAVGGRGTERDKDRKKKAKKRVSGF